MQPKRFEVFIFLPHIRRAQTGHIIDANPAIVRPLHNEGIIHFNGQRILQLLLSQSIKMQKREMLRKLVMRNTIN
jgi:hypothetical protein